MYNFHKDLRNFRLFCLLFDIEEHFFNFPIEMFDLNEDHIGEDISILVLFQENFICKQFTFTK